MITTIINLVFIAFLLLGTLSGFRRGTFKVSLRFGFLLGMFLLVWLLVPTIYNVAESYIPDSFFESISDYVTREDVSSLAPFAMRTFLTPFIWLIVAILTLPIYWIFQFVCKKIFIKKIKKPVLSADKKERRKQIKQYKKAKKPKMKSRLIGGIIGCVEVVTIIFTLCIPFSGAYETLRDEKGEMRCIQLDGFDSCEYTKIYEDTAVSKLFSFGKASSKAFELMSTSKVLGSKASFGKDLSNLVNIYFLLKDNGIDITEEIDYVELLESLDSSEILLLKDYLQSSKFLMNVMDNIGLRILMKELDLQTKYGIDISSVTLSKELGIILDVASMVIELPITKDDKINKNFLEMIDEIDDEFVDEFIASLKTSDAIEAIMKDYGKEKIEELVNENVEEYNLTFTLDLTNINILDEVKVILNSLRDFVVLDVAYYDETEEKIKVKELKDIAKTIDKEALKLTVDGIFESEILNQVVDGVASELMLKYINEALDENYTIQELGLDSIDWKEELSNDVSLVVDLINSGIVDSMEEDEILSAIVDLENGKELITQMADSTLVINLLNAIAPTYIEDMVQSLTDDDSYVLDIESLNVNWEEELNYLFDTLIILNDSGIFEDDFDLATFVSSLEVNDEIDDVAALASSMSSSKIILDILPTIASYATDKIDSEYSEYVAIDNVDWASELEPLLRVVKLAESYGVFEDDVDFIEIGKEVLKVEENINTLFNSNIVYNSAVAAFENKIEDFEFDGETLITVPEGGFGYSKEEWKSEVKLLSSVIDELGSVSKFTDIGKMNPELLETNNTILDLSKIADVAIESKLLGQVLTDKINDLLELEDPDLKTLDELKSVDWNVEILAANEILYTIDNLGSAEIEIVGDLIDTASSTKLVKDVVEDKVKENLVTIEVDGELVFTQDYVDNLNIYQIDWNKEKVAINGLDDIDSIKLPGDEGFDADVDGTKMNELIDKINQTKIVKDIASMTMNNTIEDLVIEYFYEDVDNPTQNEINELNEYMDGLNVFSADYVVEFKLLDNIDNLIDDSIDSDGYGIKLDETIELVEDSTIIGSIAQDEIREVLDDNFGDYFEDGYFDTLVLSSVSWQAELAKKSMLETFKTEFDSYSVIDGIVGSVVDEVLAEIVAPVEVDGEDKYSTILKTVAEKEVKDRIKSSLLDVVSGDITFIDELDIYNMNGYNSSFEQEFDTFSSIEEIIDEDYEFDISDIHAFEEGGTMYKIANSVLATNILYENENNYTIDVENEIIKETAFILVDGMDKCVKSIDKSNRTFGKDVLKSMFTVK